MNATPVVDTSALIAVLKREPGWVELGDAILRVGNVIPAPVLVELGVVARRNLRLSSADIADYVFVVSNRAIVVEFGREQSAAATDADTLYGIGNGRGGTLNLLDLMVYATAKVAGLPILCTGNDFAATDAAIHPASRAG